MAPKVKSKVPKASLDKAAKAADKARQTSSKRKGLEPSTLLEKEALETPLKRARSDKDVNRAIQKIVYDNLRSLSQDQLHSVIKGGLTCWERLLRDKPQADLGQLCMGKNYYKHVRMLYTGQGEDDMLQVENLDDPIDEKLLEAITELKKHNANPAPLLAWLQRQQLPNQKNAVALMRAVRAVEPAVGKHQCEVVMAVLDWCHTVEFSKSYPQLFDGVRSVFDKGLEKSWLIMKSPSVAARLWWESVCPSAGLILPVEAWRKCIYNKTRWRDCKVELREVVKSGVGQRIFAHAWREIADSEMSSTIEAAVVKLFTEEKELTPKLIDQHRQDLSKQCSASGYDLFVATKPRTIYLTYRHVQFPVMVSTFIEEFQLRVYCGIKEYGVQSGNIEPLFCESGLCGEEPVSFAGVIDKRLYKESVAARAAVQELVEDAGRASGEEIKSVLLKNNRMLNSLDKAWKVETNFFMSQIGESGEKRFESLIINALPSAEVAMELEATHAKLKSLSRSQLYQFVRVGLQRQLENIISWVGVMMRGRCPKFPETKGNEFLTKVLARFAFFLRSPVRGSAGSADARELCGRDAMVELLKQKESEMQQKKPQDLQSLRPFGTYQWLLTSEEAKKTKDWVAAVLGEPSARAKSDELLEKSKEKEKEKSREKMKKKKMTDSEQAKAAAEDCFR